MINHSTSLTKKEREQDFQNRVRKMRERVIEGGFWKCSPYDQDRLEDMTYPYSQDDADWLADLEIQVL